MFFFIQDSLNNYVSYDANFQKVATIDYVTKNLTTNQISNQGTFEPCNLVKYKDFFSLPDIAKVGTSYVYCPSIDFV